VVRASNRGEERSRLKLFPFWGEFNTPGREQKKMEIMREGFPTSFGSPTGSAKSPPSWQGGKGKKRAVFVGHSRKQVFKGRQVTQGLGERGFRGDRGREVLLLP